jgi:hypothetical protein
METKDYVYLGLVALTAAVFYWHGYLAGRSRARKSFGPVLIPRQTVLEGPMRDVDMSQPVRGHRIIRPAGFRGGKIRAVFGVN